MAISRFGDRAPPTGEIALRFTVGPIEIPAEPLDTSAATESASSVATVPACVGSSSSTSEKPAAGCVITH